LGPEPEAKLFSQEEVRGYTIIKKMIGSEKGKNLMPSSDKLRKYLILILPLFFSFLSTSLWGGSGLMMNNYPEVLVENLQIGMQYSMVELVNLPLELINQSEEPIKIRIEILKPTEAKTKKGFAPIPDIKWITISPSEVEIPAKGTYRTDVNIAIPDKNEYLGKKYHVNIRAQVVSEEKSMIRFSISVQGRLLFTIAPVKRVPMTSHRRKVNMNFSIFPPKVVLKDVPLGQRVEILSEEKEMVELQNPGKSKIKCLLQSLDPRNTVIKMREGYEACPNPEFLIFKKEEMTIGPGKKKPVKMFIEIPDQPEYQGKQYLFLAAIKTGSATSGIRYLKIFVSTAQK